MRDRIVRRASTSEAVNHLEVRHAGETYRVMVRRAPTARRFTLRVRNASGDVLLTMPARGGLSEAHLFAQRHAAWIGARLKRLPRAVPFAPGSIIPIRGVDHLVSHRPDVRGTVWIEDAEGPQDLLCVSGDAAHIARRVSDHLKRLAQKDLEAAVRHYCGRLSLPARSVTIRDTTSRWGSCSSTGSLNFSWRLILAPAFVLDYLAAHEVSHLAHMNHSPKFWKVARSLSPDVDRAEAWLNANGAQLHRYGKALVNDTAG
ncbi:MAG: metal-dependent hydrolase [Hyphomicrobiales bacterium]|nr:metal-dependent hydrolase [Hyphomicrobiales bacterium]